MESVSLSSDGTVADITLFGDANVAGTKFLDAATIYVMKVTHDGFTDELEFQLPDNRRDLIVTKVDVTAGTITTIPDGRDVRHQNGNTYKVGDAYLGNLGSLVGRNVIVGLNADNELMYITVEDQTVVTAQVKYVEKDDANDDKNYFEAVDKTKYYLADEDSATTTVAETTIFDAANATIIQTDAQAGAGVDDGDIDGDEVFKYAKLVLNKNGTVATAVLQGETDWAGLIVANDVDDKGVVTETKNNTKDFSKFIVVKDDEYIAASEIEDGDVIYYNDTDKFADVYTDIVIGSLDQVYTKSMKVDGKEYKWLTDEYNARYYDAANDTYKNVDEKWLLNADTDEDVTLVLNRAGDAVLVDTTQGEDVTTTVDYIITALPVAYLNGVDEMMNIGVSNGTASTLKIKASDLKYVNSDTKDSFKLTDAAGTALAGKETHFKIDAKTGTDYEVDDTVLDIEDPTLTAFAVNSLLRATYDEDGTIIGIKVIDPKTTMKDSKDVALKPGLTQLQTEDGKVSLADDTNIYIITGEKANDTDMKVAKTTYASYDKTTQPGNVTLKGNEKVYTKVVVYVDKTKATDIVIDASANAGGTEQNEIFADNDAAETVVAIVKGTKTGLNAKKDTTVLKEITLLNSDGEASYGDIKDGIDTIPEAGDFVTVKIDADGQVFDVAIAADALGALAVGDYEEDTRSFSKSTETLTVGGNTIRPTKAAYIATYNGTTWTATSIGAINRDTEYTNIFYYVSELQDDQVSSELIYATKGGVTVTGVSTKAEMQTALAAAIAANNDSEVAITGTIDYGNTALNVPANVILTIPEGSTLKTSGVITVDDLVNVDGTWNHTTGAITNNGLITGSGHMTINGTAAAPADMAGTGTYNVTGTTLVLSNVEIKTGSTLEFGGHVEVEETITLSADITLLDGAALDLTGSTLAGGSAAHIKVDTGASATIVDQTGEQVEDGDLVDGAPEDVPETKAAEALSALADAIDAYAADNTKWTAVSAAYTAWGSALEAYVAADSEITDESEAITELNATGTLEDYNNIVALRNMTAPTISAGVISLGTLPANAVAAADPESGVYASASYNATTNKVTVTPETEGSQYVTVTVTLGDYVRTFKYVAVVGGSVGSETLTSLEALESGADVISAKV